MSSVLFIAPADLGETVLATGALEHLLRDSDKLTVICDPAARELFRTAPQIDLILSPAPGAAFGDWVELAWKRIGRPFDLALDLRGSPAGYAIAARRRIVRKSPDVLRHFVEDVSALIGADRTLAPKLWIDDAARTAAAQIAPESGALLVLAPGGVNEAKRWPHERFAAVARRLAGGAIADARVIVLGAAVRDARITRAIVSSLDADGVSARDLGEGPDLLTAAALLERATLCIGNDNALTHIAAAVGAPTLTLFGPTDERVRAPYGPRARTLRGRSLEEIAVLPALDAGAAMGDVSTDAVEAAALDLLRAGGLR
jgi:ADP-heptose:LPS heptosyltransferase